MTLTRRDAIGLLGAGAGLGDGAGAGDGFGCDDDFGLGEEAFGLGWLARARSSFAVRSGASWASACRASFASMITKWKWCPKDICCSLATTTGQASLAHSAAFLAERILTSRGCRSESPMERMRQLR